MKYMGSKAALLRGQLGNLILDEAEESDRFVDLFAGAGSVAHFVAENTTLPVLSTDLQNYSRFLVGAITERDSSLSIETMVESWIEPVRNRLGKESGYSQLPDYTVEYDKSSVLQARMDSTRSLSENFITRHYGGHYFSPGQANVLDELYRGLPVTYPERTLGMAALLRAASSCAAAPGHTAQPFQPSETLLPYINSSWRRDPLAECLRHVSSIAPRHAKTIGAARVSDAMDIVDDLSEGDLVFCDPPYSAVQYSRFYHVLEGISLGGWDDVAGAGRAPDRSYRSASDFSMVSRAKPAMARLLEKLRSKSCRVIVTFPNAAASNGMSGGDIAQIAADAWHVTENFVDSVHSTLGGSSGEGGRGGRRQLQESVLVLEPKCSVLPVAGSRLSSETLLSLSTKQTDVNASLPSAQGA